VPLASFWESVGVISGDLFQEYLHRSHYRAGLSAVASELRDAAHIAHRCEEGQGYVPD
jgi:hypothetical protein